MAKKAKKKSVNYDEFRDILRGLRQRLKGDVANMAEAALNKTRTDASGDLSSMPIHMADIGTDNYEQEFTLSLLENEEETLQKIDAALERIESGTYGTCDECGGRITKARLRAIPFAELCIKCASARDSKKSG